MTEDSVNEKATEDRYSETDAGSSLEGGEGPDKSGDGSVGAGKAGAGGIAAEEVRTEPSSRPSRRKAIIGAGIGTVAVVAGAYGLSRLLEQPAATEVEVRYTGGESVPLGDPDSPLWGEAPRARVVLGPQNIATPQLLEPAIDSVSVRALHDGGMIGFQVEWGLGDESNLTIKTDQFRDSCAVLFAPSADETLRAMGNQSQPVTIVQWKADWQRDVEEGYQGLLVAFPNTTADLYPPLVRAAHNAQDIVVPDAYIDAGATDRIAGYAVGNYQCRMDRASAVEKIFAQGPGTVTTAVTQDGSGTGVWTGNGWRVALGKNMRGSDDGEVSLEPGKTHGVGFAVWVGADDNVGARKSPVKKMLSLNVEGVAG